MIFINLARREDASALFDFICGRCCGAEFCIELIDKAGVDLDVMFRRTYGTMYEQNAEVFSQLFHDLKRYYQGRDLDLGDVLDRFFATLLQRMFRLLNLQ